MPHAEAARRRCGALLKVPLVATAGRSAVYNACDGVRRRAPVGCRGVMVPNNPAPLESKAGSGKAPVSCQGWRGRARPASWYLAALLQETRGCLGGVCRPPTASFPFAGHRLRRGALSWQHRFFRPFGVESRELKPTTQEYGNDSLASCWQRHAIALVLCSSVARHRLS